MKISEIIEIARGKQNVKLTENSEVWTKFNGSQEFVDKYIKDGNQMYAVTTLVGSLADQKFVGAATINKLQKNLLLVYRVGVGEPLPTPVVRAAMLGRLCGLIQGASGIRKELIARLAIFLNHHLHPIVPSIGSIGASGDRL